MNMVNDAFFFLSSSTHSIFIVSKQITWTIWAQTEKRSRSQHPRHWIWKWRVWPLFLVMKQVPHHNPTSFHHNNRRSSLSHPDVGEGQSIPWRFHYSNSRCQEKCETLDTNNMNLIDIDQTQIFQSLIANPWKPL